MTAPLISMRRLFSIAQNDPSFSGVVDAMVSPGRTHMNLVQMTDSQKAYLTAALAASIRKTPVIFVADELAARATKKNLQAFIEEDIGIFFAKEEMVVDADAASEQMARERLAVLAKLHQKKLGALIVPASSALFRMMPKTKLHEAAWTFHIADCADPDIVGRQLVQAGYQWCKHVEEPGWFARRGDILDVFPMGARDPYRLSFFDNFIESIKLFDPETQRSKERMTQVFIFPAREILLDADTTAMTQRISAYVNETKTTDVFLHDIERMRQGDYFHGLDKWLTVLFEKTASIMSYCENEDTFFIIDEPLAFSRRADAFFEDFEQRVFALHKKMLLPPVASELCFSPADIMREFQGCDKLLAFCNLSSSASGLPKATSVTLTGAACACERGQDEKLASMICRKVKEGYHAYVLVGSGHRANHLKERLAGYGALPVFVLRQLSRGFDYPGARLLIIGSQDVFGIERPTQKRTSRNVRIDLFSDLRPGELVVHEQHGIGRYEGLVQLKSANSLRDYLKIIYAGGDCLYISMESFDQIQKYVGSHGSATRLSRLGGQDWHRAKERARRSIRKLAIDLVALYAKRHQIKGHACGPDTVWQREFEEDFLYQETPDQLEAISRIKEDMESDKVMDRLLCGDVGFGKTEVAFRAVFKCIMDGRQAIFLSPTTVLAQQHYENFLARVASFPVRVGLLSRFATPALIKSTLDGLRAGTVDVVIGTHRVLSKDVKPSRLGLLIVDEEQRFGVEHKEKLKTLKENVDVLTLTATPIPRTLHMSLAGIRDICVLEDPPMDRRPVETYVMDYDEQIVQTACLKEIRRGGQVFYLYNDTRKIADKAAILAESLPGARIVFAHAKMSERQLENIIHDFIRHKADVLVCTTIIESGIDMPNVNTIIVEHAHRFGLAQLYQLRGRVGRSDRQAYAYITYRKDQVLTEDAQKRLGAIRDFTQLGSGIKIALRDLEVRGAGSLLGAEQHGQMDRIGYDLYCRMLEEEINTLQSGPQSTVRQAVIDIDIDAHIPENYLPDAGQRMDLYRKIVAIKNDRDRVDLEEEIEDRYGKRPAAVEALLDISYVRAQATKNGFERIQAQKDGVNMVYAADAKPDMRALSVVLGHPDYKDKILVSARYRPSIHYKPELRARQNMTLLIRQFFQLHEHARLEQGKKGDPR